MQWALRCFCPSWSCAVPTWRPPYLVLYLVCGLTYQSFLERLALPSHPSEVLRVLRPGGLFHFGHHSAHAPALQLDAFHAHPQPRTPSPCACGSHYRVFCTHFAPMTCPHQHYRIPRTCTLPSEVLRNAIPSLHVACPRCPTLPPSEVLRVLRPGGLFHFGHHWIPGPGWPPQLLQQYWQDPITGSPRLSHECYLEDLQVGVGSGPRVQGPGPRVSEDLEAACWHRCSGSGMVVANERYVGDLKVRAGVKKVWKRHML